jgi:hypothetical protein
LNIKGVPAVLPPMTAKEFVMCVELPLDSDSDVSTGLPAQKKRGSERKSQDGSSTSIQVRK